MIADIFVFCFGLAVGSFLNVCIYRIPESRSIVHPPSSCPACGQKIAFYDNIPLVSYLLLRARCRHCGVRISPRYLIVELIAGLFALGLFHRYGLSPEIGFLYVFVAALVVVTFVDLDHRIIPDVITYPGIVVGFVGSFWLGHVTVLDSLLGILLGGGLLFLVASGYFYLTKKEGMGGGDIKLLAMIGAFLGWKATIFTIFVGSAVGTLFGIGVALQTQEGRKAAVPFGPFLSIGALLFVFFGREVIAWYFGLFS